MKMEVEKERDRTKETLSDSNKMSSPLCSTNQSGNLPVNDRNRLEKQLDFSFQIIVMRVLFFLFTYCTVIHGVCKFHVDDALSNQVVDKLKQWKIYEKR